MVDTTKLFDDLAPDVEAARLAMVAAEAARDAAQGVLNEAVTRFEALSRTRGALAHIPEVEALIEAREASALQASTLAK